MSFGDVVSLQMTCTVACSGTGSEQWALTMTDVTTSTTCFVSPSASGHCGSSGATFNWPLSINDQVFYVYEADAIVTWTPSGRWTNATYTTGLPGSQVTSNTPLSAAMASWAPGQGSASADTMSPSQPYGTNGNDFALCAPAIASTFTYCPP